MENGGGVLTTPNWIFKSEGIIDRNTAEFTPSPPLPTSPFIGRDSKNFDYTNNAFNWPYMNRLSEGGGLADIGVGNAWRALLQTNRINNRIRVMVADSGFTLPTRIFRLMPKHSASSIGLVQDFATETHVLAWGCTERGRLCSAGQRTGSCRPGGPVTQMIVLETPGF